MPSSALWCIKDVMHPYRFDGELRLRGLLESLKALDCAVYSRESSTLVQWVVITICTGPHLDFFPHRLHSAAA